MKIKLGFIFALIFMLLTHVANAEPVIWLDEGVSLKGRIVYVVQPVTNDTGKTFKEDVTALISSQLIETLKKEKLIVIESPDSERNSITIHSSLTEYEEGSAAGRWLMPGKDATKCTVRSILSDDKSGKTIGEIIASYVVDSGGLFSVGAEKYVPKSVAKDIAKAISKLAKGK